MAIPFPRDYWQNGRRSWPKKLRWEVIYLLQCAMFPRRKCSSTWAHWLRQVIDFHQGHGSVDFTRLSRSIESHLTESCVYWLCRSEYASAWPLPPLSRDTDHSSVLANMSTGSYRGDETYPTSYISAFTSEKIFHYFREIRQILASFSPTLSAITTVTID